MSNRIQPTHFIEVWRQFDGSVGRFTNPATIKNLRSLLAATIDVNGKTIALFLIRPKTPQEQANSIYYPLNEEV